MRFGIASRSMPGMSVNGDAYLVKEWNGQTLLAVIDGLGHGEEASTASNMAKVYVLENYSRDVEQIILGLHSRFHSTRGIAAELVRIDRAERRLIFCGVGNTEARIIGEPPMHPPSMDGIIGVNLRKTMKFEYRYNSLRAAVLYSDGISGGFDLSTYPSIYEQPQNVADSILAEWGKKHDDATVIVGVEEKLQC